MPDLSADEAAILDVIHRNRIAAWTQDFAAYEKCFVPAAYTTRWNASPISGIMVRRGWDDISAAAKRLFATYSPNLLNAYQTQVIDLQIRVGGDMAWATFRQAYPDAGPPQDQPSTLASQHAGPSPSHEVRFFERYEGEWRIAFLGFLDADSVLSWSALLQLSPTGTVEWQSQAATEALAAEDDLVIRNGHLRLRDRDADARLQAAIAWAAALSAPMVPRRGSLPVVVEAGEGLPTKVWWVIAENGKVYFSFGSANTAPRLDAAAIVYGLSPAQREIAGHIIAGRSVAEAADAMAITPNTARTHLDRVFDKTGVRTQPALVRALLSVAAPI